MDTRHDLASEADRPDILSQSELERSIERSAAQIEAGKVVPLEPALMQLRESADRIRRERVMAGHGPTLSA